MPTALFLVASLMTFSDEPTLRSAMPGMPAEQCVELRQFRGGGRGGCRVAVDRNIAWMCVKESSGTYGVRFKSADGFLIREYSYDKRQSDVWDGHFEVFYTSTDPK